VTGQRKYYVYGIDTAVRPALRRAIEAGVRQRRNADPRLSIGPMFPDVARRLKLG
jgi:hypothetical protein